MSSSQVLYIPDLCLYPACDANTAKEVCNDASQAEHWEAMVEGLLPQSWNLAFLSTQIPSQSGDGIRGEMVQALCL